MARKLIIGGKVFTETGDQKVIIGGKVFQSTSAGGGPSAPVLSSPTPSGTLGTETTATLGATTDITSGTFYGVVDTAGNIAGITAAQIKLGNNNGDSSAVGSDSNTVTDTSPTADITGLTEGVLYSYAVVHNDTGGDSNVLTGTFTTASAAAPGVLSLPTPSGILGTTTTATLGATTDEVSGTFYGVVDLAANMAGITAAQIKAGENANSVAAVGADSSAVGDTTPTADITGLTKGTLYSYSVIQNSVGGDSNIVSGTFTTEEGIATLSLPTPSGTLGTSETAVIGATTTEVAGVFYVVVDTAGNLSGISDAQIIAGQNNVGGAALADNSANVTDSTPAAGVTGLTENTLYSYASIQQTTGGDSNQESGTFTTSLPSEAPIQLPNYLHPELSNPKVPPSASMVEIDWSNPLVSKYELVAFIIGDTDLVSGNKFDQGAGIEGAYEYTDSSQLIYETPGGVPAPELTMITHAWSHGWPGSGTRKIININSTGAGDHFLRSTAGQALAATIRGSSGFNSMGNVWVDGDDTPYIMKGDGNSVSGYTNKSGRLTQIAALASWTDMSFQNLASRVYLKFVMVFTKRIPDGIDESLAYNPWQILKPKVPLILTVSAGVPPGSADLTGTVTASIDEDDIRAGGKTIIVTLQNDTFKAAGTGPIGSIADTQAIIDGVTSSTTPLNGWNNRVRDVADVTEIVRTSDTVLTWTIVARPGYDISTVEEIELTLPVDALVTGADPIIAPPTFTIDSTSITTEIFGPTSMTQGSPTTVIGTGLDLASLSLTNGTTSVLQTATSGPTDTEFPMVVKTGLEDVVIGTPVTGIQVTPTITAASINFPTLQILSNGASFGTDIVFGSGPFVDHECIQTNLLEANTTPGQSLFGTDLVAVEDDHQCVVPNVIGGIPITWLSTGVPVVAPGDDGTLNFTAKFYSLATQQWSALAVSIASGPQANLAGSVLSSTDEDDITAGGKTIIITLINDTFKAAGTGPIGSTADTQALIDGISAATSPTNGWNNEVRDKALTSEITRDSDTQATWLISAQSGYDISAQEIVEATVPTDVLVLGAGALTAAPTFAIFHVVEPPPPEDPLDGGIVRPIIRSIIRTIITTIIKTE